MEGAPSETIATVSLSTVSRLSLASGEADVRGGRGGIVGRRLISPCVHVHAAIKWCCKLRGSFQETAPRKTDEHTVKHRDGGVGSVVANHGGGNERLVVVTTLGTYYQLIKFLVPFIETVFAFTIIVPLSWKCVHSVHADIVTTITVNSPHPCGQLVTRCDELVMWWVDWHPPTASLADCPRFRWICHRLSQPAGGERRTSTGAVSTGLQRHDESKNAVLYITTNYRRPNPTK